MKIIEGFVLRPLGDEFIITGEGPAQVNFNKMISLNSTAAYLWRSVEGREFSVEDLTALLLEEYDVDEATASKDALAIVNKWIEIGLVEE
ncbi:MAG TPA: PqqD family protein [Candidatus Cryptobacteroides sp.]|jgi:hypothetical protein|nr:PqqD family protein [Candidatus Cryptobacteroides sp.]